VVPSEEERWARIHALRRSLPNEAVFACSTAAWIHGLDVSWSEIVEIALPKASSRRSRTGLIVRRLSLEPRDSVQMKGVSVTTLHRTLRDLCLLASPLEALIAIDSALFKRKTTKAKLLADPLATKGRRGAARFRKIAESAAPAESPMETRLRHLLLTAGLPAPEVQAELRDAQNRLLGRADLFYRDARLVIEYDGANHRDRLVSDDQRQNLIMDAGYRILRFTATDVYNRPDAVVALVRGSLAA
jgi:very-short-patch-repair endonuclease